MANLSDRIRSKLEGTGGLVPVGAIIAYSPGYYTAVANGGSFNVVGPGANTVAQINAFLPPEWRVCDGTALNDAESPIFNAAGRYLPDITGQRFLRGHTAVGAVGGNTGNQLTLNAPQLPTHGHPAGTLAADNANAPHTHPVTVATGNAPHTHPGSSVTIAGQSLDHTHTIDHNHPAAPDALAVGPTTLKYVQSDAAPGSGLGALSDSGATITTDLPNFTGSSGPALASPHTHPGSSVTIATDNAPHGHPGSTADSATAPHTHTVSGSTGDVGSGSAVDITPQYINTVYIMRIK
jgi:hypothetical protein